MVPGTAIFDDFLGVVTARSLLDIVLTQPEEFAPSTIVGDGSNPVETQARQSSTFKGDWTALKQHFSARVLTQVPKILAATGVKDWSPKRLQIDLAAHRDGDFFRTHLDTVTGRHRNDEVRMVSAVYYFHRQPKQFNGGELVIRDIRGTTETAIEPHHDRLVVFPSFLPHEVKPISVPGNDFADARFSINCWLNRPRGETRTT